MYNVHTVEVKVKTDVFNFYLLSKAAFKSSIQRVIVIKKSKLVYIFN